MKGGENMEGIEMTMNVQAPVEGVSAAMPAESPIEIGFNLDSFKVEAEKYEAQALVDVRNELQALEGGDGVLEEDIEKNEIVNIEENDSMMKEPEDIEVADIPDEIGNKDDKETGNEILGKSDFSTEVARFHEGLQNGSISPEMALAIILAYLESRTAREEGEEVSLLELAVTALTRFMLNIIPGGEEALKNMDKDERKGMGATTELGKLLKKRKLESTLIENIAA